jgi:hypothetical protein
MNFKTTYILFGVLFAVLAIFGLTQLMGLRNPTDRSVYALPSLNDSKKPVRTEDIQTVEIERTRPSAEKLVFQRTGQGWRLQQPSVRVDNYLVDRVVQQVSRARKEERADVTANLKQFGLETPAAVVTLTEKDSGREWKLNIGTESRGGDEAVVYVTSSDRKEPMAVKRNDLDALFKNVNDFRSKDLLTANTFSTNLATVQKTGQDAVVVEKTSEGKWRFQKPALGEAEFEGESTGSAAEQKRLTGVRELIDAIGAIRVSSEEDFVATDVKDEELAQKYGLASGKPALLRIEVKRTESSVTGGEEKKSPVTDALLIGKKVEEKDDKKPATDKGDMYYARLESERAVVKVPAKNVESILKVAEDPHALRNRDLVQLDTFKTDAIDIKNAAEPLKLRRTGQPESWKLFTGAGQPRNADDRAVQDLLTALTTKRQVKSFPDASRSDAELGLDKPTAEVSLWVDGVKKDEPKEEKKDQKAAEKKDAKAEVKKEGEPEPKLKSDQPTVKLVFGKRDNGVVYIRRETGGDKVRLAVPDTLLAKVMDGPLAYLERILPSFSSGAEVTKLVLERGGQTYEIDKEKKDENSPAVWKLKQPEDLAGRTADSRQVENILNELRTLSTDKYVAEKPSENELDRYGLKSPAIKATVTVKGKDNQVESHVYLVGKETEDKAGRYAKQGEREMVFQVRPNVATTLQAELLDPTVFRFDAAKVKGLKLTGWQDVVGSAFTLDVERKSSQDWAVKAPPGFTLDAAQAEALVASLRNLRAERFLTPKGEAKPEHKLDVKDGALQIEVTVEGEKEPYQLTVGAGHGTDGYHAQTNRLPGAVFVVAKDRFEKAKSKPAYFKKD